MIEDAKARQASGAPLPPEAPPPADSPLDEIYGECEGEEDEGDMTYDIPEEALQEYQMSVGQGKAARHLGENLCLFCKARREVCVCSVRPGEKFVSVL